MLEIYNNFICVSLAEIPDEGTALQPKGMNNGFGDADMHDPFSADPFAQVQTSIKILLFYRLFIYLL